MVARFPTNPRDLAQPFHTLPPQNSSKNPRRRLDLAQNLEQGGLPRVSATGPDAAFPPSLPESAPAYHVPRSVCDFMRQFR